jgi:hypothetical protein
MRKLIGVAILFICGYLAGFMTMGYLAMESVPALLQSVDQDFEREQWALAIQAKQRGNIDQAIVHYSHVVWASESAAERNRHGGRTWTFFFPLAGPILGSISQSTAKEKGAPLQEALYRGLLADALEKSGRTAEARQSYLRAAQLLGQGDDIERVRTLVNETLSHESDLLKITDRSK